VVWYVLNVIANHVARLTVGISGYAGDAAIPWIIPGTYETPGHPEGDIVKRVLTMIVLVSGLVLALAACGVGGQSSSADSSGTNGGSAATDTSGSTTGSGGSAGTATTRSPRTPGVIGVVQSVNGSTITVQSRSQQTMTVNLTSSTQISKQASIQLSAIPSGASITATGAQNGTIFTATQIRVLPGNAQNGQNGGQGFAGAPQRGQGNGGQNPARTTTARPPATRIFGTVQQISNNTLTVQTAAGATLQVQLAANGQVLQQASATAADITNGERISALGTMSGTTLTATRVDIVPAAPQQ